jgi:membrane protein
MWIFITWLIVLFGLQLTYATQHLKTLDAAELARMKKKTDGPLFLTDEITLVRVVMYIVEQFQARRGPVNAEAMAAHFDMPADFTEKILDHLVARGLLFETAEPRVGYAPTTEARNIRLSDVTDAVAAAAFGQTGHGTDPLKPVLQARRALLADHTIDEFVRPERQESPALVQEEQDADPPPSDPAA